MKNNTTSPSSLQVSPESAFRVMDRLSFITPLGLSDSPGDKPNENEILYAMYWVSAFCKPRKSINYKMSSYQLKHLVEASFDHSVYVSNGAFIEAALRLGYKFIAISYSPNAYFNMSTFRGTNGNSNTVSNFED